MRTLRFLANVLITLLAHDSALAQATFFPTKVGQWAQARGCADITEWYVTEDLLDPPYVMGWLPGGRDQSAVYVCISKSDKNNVKLVFEGDTTCPKEIEWPGNWLPGISIVHERRPLERFTYWDKGRRRSGPAKMTTRGPYIYAGHDGTGYYFYCHDGKWLAGFVH
jgi:hypothetical protein